MATEIEEKVPDELKPTVEAIHNAAREIVGKIDKRMHDPVSRAAENAVALSTKEQLGQVLKKNLDRHLGLAWSNTKAIGMGILSLLPVLGGGAELADAAIIEGATAKQAAALANGAKILESGEVAYPLAKILQNEAVKRVGAVVKELDPFEGVPGWFVAGSGIAEAAGLEGAGALPAGAKLVMNQVEGIKTDFQTGKEIAGILKDSPEADKVRGFVSSAMNSIRDRLQQATQPHMAAAAQAFA